MQVDKNISFKHFVKKDSGVDFINVIRSDGFKVVLADLGASLYEVYFEDRLMTLTPKYVSDFKKPGLYHGKTVGRFCNRIKDGIINVAGQTYHLDQNEYPNTLHSGSSGFSNRYFDYEIDDNEEFLTVIFSYLSPDLDAGFPGELHARVIYFFPKVTGACFQIFYDARTSYETLYRPTNHAYFNLGHDSIEELGLYINADRYVIPGKDDLIPKRMDKIPYKLDYSKDIESIKKSIFDKELLAERCKGIDHFYRLKKQKLDEPNIILTDNEISLTIHTDFQGVQIYSDNYEDGIEYKGTKKLLHRGIAIEPNDSPFQKNILKPLEKYHRTNFYYFHDLRKK